MVTCEQQNDLTLTASAEPFQLPAPPPSADTTVTFKEAQRIRLAFVCAVCSGGFSNSNLLSGHAIDHRIAATCRRRCALALANLRIHVCASENAWHCITLRRQDVICRGDCGLNWPCIGGAGCKTVFVRISAYQLLIIVIVILVLIVLIIISCDGFKFAPVHCFISFLRIYTALTSSSQYSVAENSLQHSLLPTLHPQLCRKLLR